MAQNGGSIVAVDIGGTNLRTGQVLPDLSVADFDIVKSVPVLEVDLPVEALAEHLSRYMARYLEGGLPAAVVLGFPGTLDKDRQRVLSTTNLRALQNLPVVELLQDALGVPVFIDKDVNMHLRYDIWDLQLKNRETVVGFYVGTGCGNAIAFDGTVYLGAHGASGELGHIPVVGNTEVCGCGNIGCIETLASGMTLERLARRYFPDTPIAEIFVRHGGAEVLESFVRDLAIPMATEVNILDPEVVILGGGTLAMRGFPLGDLKAHIQRYARKPHPSLSLEFMTSRLSQENGVIGGGILGFECLKMSAALRERSRP